MILIFVALSTLLLKWLSRRRTLADGRHPIELLEHAPNNYELASSISFILPLVEWLNRLEDSPRWAWLLLAKDSAQWHTPDAPLGWIFRLLNKADHWLWMRTGLRIVYVQRAAFLAKCDVLEKPAYKQCESDDSAHGFRLMLDAVEADHFSATGRMMMDQVCRRARRRARGRAHDVRACARARRCSRAAPAIVPPARLGRNADRSVLVPILRPSVRPASIARLLRRLRPARV
jgi:hypothetical protein